MPRPLRLLGPAPGSSPSRALLFQLFNHGLARLGGRGLGQALRLHQLFLLFRLAFLQRRQAACPRAGFVLAVEDTGGWGTAVRQLLGLRPHSPREGSCRGPHPTLSGISGLQGRLPQHTHFIKECTEAQTKRLDLYCQVTGAFRIWVLSTNNDQHNDSNDSSCLLSLSCVPFKTSQEKKKENKNVTGGRDPYHSH